MGAALFVADVETSAATEALAGGRTGASFDPADPEGAALRLDALLSDPVRLATMRAAALEEARVHDVHSSVTQLEALYRRALSGQYRQTRAARKRAAPRKDRA